MADWKTGSCLLALQCVAWIRTLVYFPSCRSRSLFPIVCQTLLVTFGLCDVLRIATEAMRLAMYGFVSTHGAETSNRQLLCVIRFSEMGARCIALAPISRAGSRSSRPWLSNLLRRAAACNLLVAPRAQDLPTHPARPDARAHQTPAPLGMQSAGAPEVEVISTACILNVRRHG